MFNVYKNQLSRQTGSRQYQQNEQSSLTLTRLTQTNWGMTTYDIENPGS
jgi:hypothetical protein